MKAGTPPFPRSKAGGENERTRGNYNATIYSGMASSPISRTALPFELGNGCEDLSPLPHSSRLGAPEPRHVFVPDFFDICVEIL
jgi:hypothetical protein